MGNIVIYIGERSKKVQVDELLIVQVVHCKTNDKQTLYQGMKIAKVW